MKGNYGEVRGTPSRDNHVGEREVDGGRRNMVSPSCGRWGRWTKRKKEKKARLRGTCMQQDKVGCVVEGGEIQGMEDAKLNLTFICKN